MKYDGILQLRIKLDPQGKIYRPPSRLYVVCVSERAECNANSWKQY